MPPYCRRSGRNLTTHRSSKTKCDKSVRTKGNRCKLASTMKRYSQIYSKWVNIISTCLSLFCCCCCCFVAAYIGPSQSKWHRSISQTLDKQTQKRVKCDLFGVSFMPVQLFWIRLISVNLNFNITTATTINGL